MALLNLKELKVAVGAAEQNKFDSRTCYKK